MKLKPSGCCAPFLARQLEKKHRKGSSSRDQHSSDAPSPARGKCEILRCGFKANKSWGFGSCPPQSISSTTISRHHTTKSLKDGEPAFFLPLSSHQERAKVANLDHLPHQDAQMLLKPEHHSTNLLWRDQNCSNLYWYVQRETSSAFYGLS